MQRNLSTARRAALFVTLAWLWATPLAHAQTTSNSSSLGGYGATATSPLASMGSSNPTIPYAGTFSGFMPYRMASPSSSPLSFSPRASSALESTRTSFRLSPISSGMGAGLGPDRGLFAPMGARGTMPTGGALFSQPMGGRKNTSVMPPNFGYPFYQPPSLLSPVSPGSGMSM